LSGGSGYSAALSSNAAIRHQQLICDPAPGSGSASITYDPSVVSIYSIFNEPNYAVDMNNTYVGESNKGNAMAMAPGYFNNITGSTESGLIQVTWTSSPGLALGKSFIGSQPNDPATFRAISSFGTNDGGVNVFGLEFFYLPSTDTTNAPFTIYADAGGRTIYNPSTNSFPGTKTASDYLTDPNDSTGTAIPYTQISPASVNGSLVPEPAGLALLGLAALGVLVRRRRSV
jgi:hypothetical protein